MVMEDWDALLSPKVDHLRYNIVLAAMEVAGVQSPVHFVEGKGSHHLHKAIRVTFGTNLRTIVAFRRYLVCIREQFRTDKYLDRALLLALHWIRHNPTEAEATARFHVNAKVYRQHNRLVLETLAQLPAVRPPPPCTPVLLCLPLIFSLSMSLPRCLHVSVTLSRDEFSLAKVYSRCFKLAH